MRVDLGTNSVGYPMAYVSMDSKYFDVIGYSTSDYICEVYIQDSKDNIHTVKFPHQLDGHVTLVWWKDKYTISLIVTPIDFVLLDD